MDCARVAICGHCMVCEETACQATQDRFFLLPLNLIHVIEQRGFHFASEDAVVGDVSPWFLIRVGLFLGGRHRKNSISETKGGLLPRRIPAPTNRMGSGCWPVSVRNSTLSLSYSARWL